MARNTIVIGILLILLGVGVYVGLAVAGDSSPSITALIPAFAGFPILLAGLFALKESLRKHAMHLVSILALVGFLMPSGRLAMMVVRGAELKPVGTISLLAMSLLCGLLLALCIKSFVNARKAAS